MSIAAKGVAADEIAKFSKLQKHWWDPSGPLRSLHLLNPIRARFVNTTVQNFGKRAGGGGLDFLSNPGLTPAHKVLDVGCGGGILSESLARLGGTVLGIDACDESIQVASLRQKAMLENASRMYSPEAVKHAWQSRLSFATTSLFDVVEKEQQQFDVVVASEVIEHVSDARGFLQALCDATAPGGLLILSTMDKTICTAISHILIAEKLTGIVEPGTHDWTKFIPPQDMTQFAGRFGVRNVDLQYIITYPDLFQSVATKNFQVNFALSRSVNTGHYFWAGLKSSAPAAKAQTKTDASEHPSAPSSQTTA